MRLRHLPRLVLAPILLTLAGVASAQDPGPIVTDRPGFTDSGVVLPAGSIQVETGVSATWDGTSESLSGPEALVRWAPRARLELRLTAPNYALTDPADGLGDVGLGVKLAPFRTVDWSLAVLAGVTLPSGDPAFTADAVVPSVTVVAGRPLSGDASITGQFGITWPAAFDRPDVAGTVSLGRSLTGTLGAFLEVLAADAHGAEPAVVLHHGYALALARHSQLDAHVGVGLTKAAADVLVGIGWSTRF